MSKVPIAEFYSWHRHPFADTTRLKQPYLPNRDQRTIKFAESLISMGKGFALCGPSGSGKTTLARHLIDQLDTRHYTPCLVSYGGFNRGDLLRLLAERMGVDSTGRRTPLLHRLHQQIQQLADQQQSLHPLLIIDDAQLLERASLLDLCSLITAQSDNTTSASIILIGDESLAKQLSLRVLAPVSSRLGAVFQQQLLSEEETHAFVTHRLRIAKVKTDLFESEVLSLMAAQTSGNRRQLMNLATMLLQEAYDRNENTISAQVLLESSFSSTF